MMENGMSPADVMAMTNNNDGFNGTGGWLWFLIVMFSIFGWGGNGFGARTDNAQIATESLNANMQRGFDNQNIMQRFSELQTAQAANAKENALLINSAMYENSKNFSENTMATMNAQNQLQMGMMNGFNGVDKSICQSTYATTTAMNAGFDAVNQNLSNLSHQISDGVCALKTQMLQDKYDKLLNDYNLSTMANANAVQTQNILGAIGSWYAKPPYAPMCPMAYNGTTIA